MKTTEAGGPRGDDAGTKVNGRKRPRGVDPRGMLLAVVVPAAGLPDRDGAKRVRAKLQGRFPRLKLIWAEGASEAVVGWTKAVGGWVRELVRKPEGLRRFQGLPRRGVVERTFGWLNRSRRHSKDDERDPGSSEAMVYLALIQLMLKRLCYT